MAKAFALSTLDRDTIVEFVQVLTVGTLAVLGIFFGTVEFKNMLDTVTMFGIPIPTVFSIWLLQIPTGAMYALPAGILISSIIVLMRKQRDSEMVALRTLGVSRLRIARPFILMGIACSILSFSIGEWVAPQAKHLASKRLLIEVCRSTRPFPHLNMIQLHGPDDRLAQILVLGQNAGSAINGFVLMNLCQDGVIQLTWSKLAERVRGDWRLKAGHLFEMFSSDPKGYKGFFGAMTIPAATRLWSQIENEPANPLEKTTAQLRAQIERCSRTGKPAPGETMVQYYRRFSQPASCLLLMLAALPLAFMVGRRDAKIPLGYAAITVPIYFLMQQVFLSLGENGAVNPCLAAWAPSVVLCLLAIGFARVVD